MTGRKSLGFQLGHKLPDRGHDSLGTAWEQIFRANIYKADLYQDPVGFESGK